MPETVTLIRDGQPLRFTGELLLDYEAKDANPRVVRWFSVKLWKTAGGNWIAEAVYCTGKSRFEQSLRWVFGPHKNPATLIDELDAWDCHQGVAYYPSDRSGAVHNPIIEENINARWEELVGQVRIATGQVEEVA
jgi:hypothetical protein